MTSLHGSPVKLVSNQSGFPHPVSMGVMRVVAQAIKHAWAVIEDDPGTHLVSVGPSAPEEDVYTEALCNMLLQMLKSQSPPVPGFSGDLFENVSRGEHLTNYSAENLNKRPDLIVHLAKAPLDSCRRYVGIYIEAKIVSMKTPIGEYTKHGLKRFVNGEYAWAMQGAMMLAYQAQKPRPLAALAGALKKDGTLGAIPDDTGAHLNVSPNCAPLCGHSTHIRPWSYQAGGSPGPIKVWHMWTLHVP